MTHDTQYPSPLKSTQSIGDTAYATKALGTCSRLLAVAGLENLLRGEGDFTLFAPTDAAFKELPDGALQSLEQSPRELRDMLEYHILEVGRELTQLGNGKLRTLQGTLLTATVTDDGLNLDHASTCGRGTRCANGVIHQIDRVLMPGFTPKLSAAALAPSAWSGQRAAARIPKAPANDAWPFIEPQQAKDSSGTA